MYINIALIQQLKSYCMALTVCGVFSVMPAGGTSGAVVEVKKSIGAFGSLAVT